MKQLLHRSRPRTRGGTAAVATVDAAAPPPRPPARPLPHKRHVNDLIEAGLPPQEHSPLVAFLCECGDADCLQTVWLRGDDYVVRRAESGWTVRAPGHEAA
jgi:hypothetical protein